MKSLNNNAPKFRPTEAQQKFAFLATSGPTRAMAFGGSRSGKTFEIVREIATIANVVGGRCAIFRKNFNAVKTSVFGDTLPKVLDLCFPGVERVFNKSDYCVSFPSTGGEIWALGLDDKERVDKILGKEFAVVYFNECSEISYHAVETALTRLSQRVPGLRRNLAFFDCNPPTKSHWAYKLFVEKKNPVSNLPLKNPEDYVAMKMNPTDNAANLPPGYVEKTLENLSGKKRERFLLGNWTDENENALWKPSLIDPFRKSLEVVRNEGGFERVVVGVDPAVTSNDSSDSTGIVVVASRKEADSRRFYVLEDATLSASPERWAQTVVATFERWKADRVVVETNNGGDLVAATLRNISANLPVKNVRATRGKILRAEPVAALYERGLVSHVGEFFELEEQMTSFTGTDPAEKSPDRLDALVWALTDLAIGGATVKRGDFRFN